MRARCEHNARHKALCRGCRREPLPCNMAVVAMSRPCGQCPMPTPCCADTYWRRYIPGWNRKMSKCEQPERLTVRLVAFCAICRPSRGEGPCFGTLQPAGGGGG